jgi:hypothetical protein
VTYVHVGDYPDPRWEVGVDQVAREEVAEVDADAGELYVSLRARDVQQHVGPTKVRFRTRLGMMG